MLKCKGRKTPTISSRGARTKCNAGQSELQQVFNLKVTKRCARMRLEKVFAKKTGKDVCKNEARGAFAKKRVEKACAKKE